MGQYIVLAILVVIIFSFIFGENIFKSAWIPSSIRSSLLVVGSMIFYFIAGYCFYNYVISSGIDNKYLYLGAGVFLLMLTTTIMIRGIKNIRINQVDVDTNAKEANVVVIEKDKSTNLIGKIGTVMILSTTLLIIVLVSFLYL